MTRAYFYSGEFDDFCEPDDGDDTPKPTACNGCGKSVSWHHTGIRWALLDASGNLHNCRSSSASASEFAVIPDFDANDPAQGLG